MKMILERGNFVPNGFRIGDVSHEGIFEAALRFNKFRSSEQRPKFRALLMSSNAMKPVVRCVSGHDMKEGLETLLRNPKRSNKNVRE